MKFKLIILIFSFFSLNTFAQFSGKTKKLIGTWEYKSGNGFESWHLEGEFLIGETAKIAYVDQSHANIDLDKSIWENFSDGQELIMMGNRQVNSRAYLSRFNFSGSEQNKKVNTLSGGERNRLHLAMTLKEEGNVLLLDEPTNDLDVNTLRALEEGLENFAGCAVVISHDRWFLDRIATHILAFEGDSQANFFEGNYSEYEADRKKRLGKDFAPTRVRYKKLAT